jgi:TolA-binding protein
MNAKPMCAKPRSGVAGSAGAAAAAALALCVLLGACAGPDARQAPAAGTASATAGADREPRLRALQQAEALYLSGHLKEAQASFEQLTRTYPRNAEVWFRLGNTLLKQGDYDAAAVALQNAMLLDPGQGRAAMNLALVRLGQAQSALETARTRLQASSPQRERAEEMQRRIRTLLAGSADQD